MEVEGPFICQKGNPSSLHSLFSSNVSSLLPIFPPRVKTIGEEFISSLSQQPMSQEAMVVWVLTPSGLHSRLYFGVLQPIWYCSPLHHGLGWLDICFTGITWSLRTALIYGQKSVLCVPNFNIISSGVKVLELLLMLTMIHGPNFLLDHLCWCPWGCHNGSCCWFHGPRTLSGITIG